MILHLSFQNKKESLQCKYLKFRQYISILFIMNVIVLKYPLNNNLINYLKDPIVGLALILERMFRIRSN